MRLRAKWSNEHEALVCGRVLCVWRLEWVSTGTRSEETLGMAKPENRGRQFFFFLTGLFWQQVPQVQPGRRAVSPVPLYPWRDESLGGVKGNHLIPV
jgi:hypothetical protein